MFSSKKINWYRISANKNITLNIIEKNLDLNLNWMTIANNPNLTIYFVRKYQDKF